jgi:L-alanine-DL-glutamate epimerase-like enolase superfamily enzyme
LNAVLALREAFGEDVPIRIDPNALWKVENRY